MAQASAQPSAAQAAESQSWEKSAAAAPKVKRERLKFLMGGALILAAVVILIGSGTLNGARFFITVDDLLANSAYTGQSVRITGAVIGDTIVYDPENLIIEFTIAHVPNEFDDLGEALHIAANNPTANRIQVRVENQVKPDLLRHEAQAILTGTLDADGVFHATELNLKCPTRFVEGMPQQLLDEGIVAPSV
ncbi:MAG: cytochrome c maturation protein CcmE [bacterium]|nr:cytochrome c maturation protein CcmE [bacterium]